MRNTVGGIAMCITRVGRVLSVSEGKAEVEFFDENALGEVDVSVVGGAPKGAYLEVYGNLALSILSAAEARRRKVVWKEVRKAALMPPLRRKSRF